MKAKGLRRKPILAPGLDITNCDLQFCSSCWVSWNMKSGGNRRRLRLTAWTKTRGLPSWREVYAVSTGVLAARIIATMQARIASGRLGQASMIVRKFESSPIRFAMSRSFPLLVAYHHVGQEANEPNYGFPQSRSEAAYCVRLSQRVYTRFRVGFELPCVRRLAQALPGLRMAADRTCNPAGRRSIAFHFLDVGFTTASADCRHVARGLFRSCEDSTSGVVHLRKLQTGVKRP